jgi:hypothetical protein
VQIRHNPHPVDVEETISGACGGLNTSTDADRCWLLRRDTRYSGLSYQVTGATVSPEKSRLD